MPFCLGPKSYFVVLLSFDRCWARCFVSVSHVVVSVVGCSVVRAPSSVFRCSLCIHPSSRSFACSFGGPGCSSCAGRSLVCFGGLAGLSVRRCSLARSLMCDGGRLVVHVHTFNHNDQDQNATPNRSTNQSKSLPPRLEVKGAFFFFFGIDFFLSPRLVACRVGRNGRCRARLLGQRRCQCLAFFFLFYCKYRWVLFQQQQHYQRQATAVCKTTTRLDPATLWNGASRAPCSVVWPIQ